MVTSSRYGVASSPEPRCPAVRVAASTLGGQRGHLALGRDRQLVGAVGRVGAFVSGASTVDGAPVRRRPAGGAESSGGSRLSAAGWSAGPGCSTWPSTGPRAAGAWSAAPTDGPPADGSFRPPARGLGLLAQVRRLASPSAGRTRSRRGDGHPRPHRPRRRLRRGSLRQGLSGQPGSARSSVSTWRSSRPECSTGAGRRSIARRSRCGRSRCRPRASRAHGIDSARAGSSRLDSGARRQLPRARVASACPASPCSQAASAAGQRCAGWSRRPTCAASVARRSRPARWSASTSPASTPATTCVVLLGPASELGWAATRRRDDLATAVVDSWRASSTRANLVIEVVSHRAGGTGRARAPMRPGWPPRAAATDCGGSTSSSPTRFATPTEPMRRRSTSSTPYAGWCPSTLATSTGPTPRATSSPARRWPTSPTRSPGWPASASARRQMLAHTRTGRRSLRPRPAGRSRHRRGAPAGPARLRRGRLTPPASAVRGRYRSSLPARPAPAVERRLADELADHRGARLRAVLPDRRRRRRPDPVHVGTGGRTRFRRRQPGQLPARQSPASTRLRYGLLMERFLSARCGGRFPTSTSTSSRRGGPRSTSRSSSATRRRAAPASR